MAIEVKDAAFDAAPAEDDKVFAWASTEGPSDYKEIDVAGIRFGWDTSRKSKLDGIETAATADQTGAEIKSLYEAEANTNAYTDSEKTKLGTVETNAKDDQTGAEIKSLYEGEADTNAFTDAEQTKLGTVETNAKDDQTGAEIKALYEGETDTNAYTDSEKAKLAAIDATHYGAPLQDLVELRALPEAGITDKERRFVENEKSDYFYDATAVSGDEAPDDQTGGTGFWRQTTADGETAASIKTKYESNADTNAFTDAEQSKLSGVESNATADQTGAEIKAAYEGEANTNAFTDTEQSKLAGIEASATADQTGAEIKAAYEGEANTNAFTDTEQTKLAGIETSATADQTGAEIKSLYEAEADTNAYDDAAAALVATISSKLSNPSVITKSGTSEAALASDVSNYVRLTNAAAKTFSVPLNATTAIATEAVITVRNAGAGEATMSPEGGVTLNALTLTLEEHQVGQLIKIGTDEWDFIA